MQKSTLRWKTDNAACREASRGWWFHDLSRTERTMLEEAQQEVEEITPPRKLAARIKKAIAKNPERPWDDALADIAEGELS